MTDWKQEMRREVEHVEWAHRCGWQQGVADTLAAFCDLRARFGDLHIVVPAFAEDFDALLKQPQSTNAVDPVDGRDDEPTPREKGNS